ncbi:lipid A export permease/ATP-binding protein MsbA [Ideonella paludis]|uniref:Lipid A export permease/ATP-binding protein MsbA n=2 Tax=Ideonella paludis TaxID=1233411 RepID=A0ABS5DX54_9BURK|nr:lipid A export permease/ATP-binding protein MsbA [Ideonella paludis]MBQ0935725.1 lipid A export permease/ATP-binding protein MsbA [Ideonella paludis]
MHDLLPRFRRLAPYFRDGRKAWVVAFFASLITGLTEPLTAYLMMPLIDQGFAGKIPLWIVPVVIIGLFSVRGLFSFVGQYALAWAAQRGVLELRTAMFRRLMNAQPSVFAERSASSLTNSLVHEVVTGAQQLASALNTLVKDSLALVGLLAYLLYLNWQLTLVITVLMPSVAWAMRVAGKRLRKLALASQSSTDELAYAVEENVLAWRIVRLHGAAAQEGQRFATLSERLRSLMLKSVAAQAAITPITQIMASVAMSAVVVIALWQSQTNGATVGQFTSYVTGMLMLITPIKHLADVMGPITRGLTALERGVDLIEHVPAESGGSHQASRAQGQITLADVQVRYHADQAPALDQLSLSVQAGETVALVGPSGAGKSTLVHLLPRFAEPTHGQVSLDGVPLPDWDIHSLRQQFALVSQDVVLFNDTVLANVALGDTPDEARATDALRHANLLDFVQGLPQGLHSAIGHNGNQLSGGQRQRLAIARALYKNAPVLILDEATSALDAESEHLVQQALDHLMQGRTTLVIAHRLATIERADRIVVMEAGRIIEQGSHAQLLAAEGLYAKLHAMQFRA